MSNDLRILRDLGFTPEIATELGHMCVAWAALEFRMFCLFNRLSDLPVALARASFYSHRSTRDRGDLILTTAKMVLQLRALGDRMAPLLRASLGKLDRTRFVTLAFEKTKPRRGHRRVRPTVQPPPPSTSFQ